MKAERAEPKQEFVPVIVMLESQEEVDALYALINHSTITGALPILDKWWRKLVGFAGKDRDYLWEKLNDKIR